MLSNHHGTENKRHKKLVDGYYTNQGFISNYSSFSRKFAYLHRFLPKQETTNYHQFLNLVSSSGGYSNVHVKSSFSSNRVRSGQMAIQLQHVSIHGVPCILLGSGITLHHGACINKSICLRCEAS